MNPIEPIERGKPKALWLSLALSLALAGVGTSCRMVRTAVDAPGKTIRAVRPGNEDHHKADPVEVQQALLRFADEYTTRMTGGVEDLRRGVHQLSRAEALEAKIALGTETCSIASGPNAMANLVDMTVFVTVMRMALEQHWQPRVFGESARSLLEYSRSAETEIWRLAGTVLTPEQQTELHERIAAWHSQNPQRESIVATRTLGFASRVTDVSGDKEAAPGSVFGLLKVDPLAGMDPAVREIAQTRMFAERALYATQKMPLLLRWQTELLSVNAVELPAVRQLVTNSTQIAASVERFGAMAQKLPGQLSAERAAILEALETQEKNLTPFVNEVRGTLMAGTQMSTSLTATLGAFDLLMKRFGVGETNRAEGAKTNTEPFRVQDYGRAAMQLEATARRLTELVRTLDETLGSANLARLSAQVAPVVEQAQSSGKQVVDYAFRKALLLVVVILATALVYRLGVAILLPPRPKAISP